MRAAQDSSWGGLWGGRAWDRGLTGRGCFRSPGLQGEVPVGLGRGGTAQGPMAGRSPARPRLPSSPQRGGVRSACPCSTLSRIWTSAALLMLRGRNPLGPASLPHSLASSQALARRSSSPGPLQRETAGAAILADPPGQSRPRCWARARSHPRHSPPARGASGYSHLSSLLKASCWRVVEPRFELRHPGTPWETDGRDQNCPGHARWFGWGVVADCGQQGMVTGWLWHSSTGNSVAGSI